MEFPIWYQVLVGFFLFTFGTCVYSFLNVVICRLPQKMDIVKMRSHCFGCQRVLKPLELIPVWSYLFQGGKCKGCGAKIGMRDMLMEVFGGLSALFCAWYYQDSIPKALTAFAFIGILSVVAWIDQDTMEILPSTLFVMLGIGVISVFTMPEIGILSRVIGAFCVSVPLLLICMFIDGAFGGGDIKLMFVVGIVLGWKLTVVSVLIGFITGGVAAVILLSSKKKGRKDHFPFGPYLCVGAAVALFYGEALIQWYLNLAM